MRFIQIYFYKYPQQGSDTTFMGNKVKNAQLRLFIQIRMICFLNKVYLVIIYYNSTHKTSLKFSSSAPSWPA